MEASTSHNPMGLHGLLQGSLYLTFFKISEYLTAHQSFLLQDLRFCSRSWPLDLIRLSQLMLFITYDMERRHI
jgi:hypothetical protein